MFPDPSPGYAAGEKKAKPFAADPLIFVYNMTGTSSGLHSNSTDTRAHKWNPSDWLSES